MSKTRTRRKAIIRAAQAGAEQLASAYKEGIIEMNTQCYLKPAWTHNGSVRTDLPLVVTRRANKKKVAASIRPGQLLCVGKVYLKTQNHLIRIK